jgi:hypothetical protein
VVAKEQLGKHLKLEEVSDLELLAVYLLKEKNNPSSPWRPYFGTCASLAVRFRVSLLKYVDVLLRAAILMLLLLARRVGLC